MSGYQIGARTQRLRRVLGGLGFTAPADSRWRERAACVGVDPELFYPVGTGEQLLVQVEAAKRVCAGCPVRRECLADVMGSEDPGQRWGICGGLSPAERSELFAAHRASGAREVA
jgi:WhiB family transcriptional regulator, redox-sensing transcriptional regulator